MKIFLMWATALLAGSACGVALVACGPDVEQATVTQTKTDTVNTVTQTTTQKAPINPTKTVTEQVKPPNPTAGTNHQLPPGVFQVNRYQFLMRVGYESNLPRICPPFKYDGNPGDNTDEKTETDAIDIIKVFTSQYFLVECTASLPKGYYRQRGVQGWLPSPYTRGEKIQKDEAAKK